MRARNNVEFDFYINDYLTISIKDTSLLKLLEIIQGTELEAEFEKVAQVLQIKKKDEENERTRY